jgi:dTDP-4-amino-4,6-dideoxygalactose transaminase
MRVDYFSFSYADSRLLEEWKSLLSNVIDEGTFIGGDYVSEFEESWSKFTQSKYSIGVSNGLDGLILALRALGIGEGDCVAVPAHTFIATWSAIIAVGAIPIGVDVDDDALIDLGKLRLLAKSVKAVIPVHMHGSTVDMLELYQICNDPSLDVPIHIIEDASQAHGATNSDGSNLGKYSDIAVYSLYPTKNLGALGDAGVVTTDKGEVAEKLRSLSNYGSDKDDKYFHHSMGYNNRLDSIQAVILKKNLELLPSWNQRRKSMSSIYIQELSEYFTILQNYRSESVRHHLCILNPERDNLREFLKSNEIATEIHYPNVAGVEALRFLKRFETFENSTRIARTTLSLPLSQWHTEDQINYVISKLKQWANL